MDGTPSARDRDPQPERKLDQAALTDWLGDDSADALAVEEEVRAFLADRRIHVSRDEFDRWIRQIAERARQQSREDQDRPLGMRWT
ncbi:MAG: hypothetical protein JOZ99_03645 [Actinobacteria bacterium]|nr:hypothetical protein [Actinomycetota bacterium]